jgi:hypothetical protein
MAVTAPLSVRSRGGAFFGGRVEPGPGVSIRPFDVAAWVEELQEHRGLRSYRRRCPPQTPRGKLRESCDCRSGSNLDVVSRTPYLDWNKNI